MALAHATGFDANGNGQDAISGILPIDRARDQVAPMMGLHG